MGPNYWLWQIYNERVLQQRAIQKGEIQSFAEFSGIATECRSDYADQSEWDRKMREWRNSVVAPWWEANKAKKWNEASEELNGGA